MSEEALEDTIKRKKALLVGVYKGAADKSLCESHLEELEQLAKTYGIEDCDQVFCPVKKIDASTYIGSGKIQELVDMAKKNTCDLVIFDDEILPSQQRNLEKAFSLTVMDRTELILEVFAQRAQSYEACLQIEIAQVKYQFPRLKRLWTHLHRQRGGGVFLKGEGEKQIEIDKRLLSKRLKKLEAKLKEVKKSRAIQRSSRKRQAIPTFAIVGYTNVGKSTLLNALTEANVLAEDKLFATLDTTTRKFTLPNGQEILLIDTVGFIRKIPHTLVAAFRSTLEESVEADILLHLVDTSHPQAIEQVKEAQEVLKELGADQKPTITVLNKIDCAKASLVNYMRIHTPFTVQISALEKTGFEDLKKEMLRQLSQMRAEYFFRIPQRDYQKVSELLECGYLLSKDYDENDVLLRMDLPKKLLSKYESYLVDK